MSGEFREEIVGIPAEVSRDYMRIGTVYDADGVDGGIDLSGVFKGSPTVLPRLFQRRGAPAVCAAILWAREPDGTGVGKTRSLRERERTGGRQEIPDPQFRIAPVDTGGEGRAIALKSPGKSRIAENSPILEASIYAGLSD